MDADELTDLLAKFREELLFDERVLRRRLGMTLTTQLILGEIQFHQL